ncbi:MAG: lysostaphin resistance A-like protein, partial [Prevotella sp.]
NIINNDYGYFVICLFAPLVEEIVFRGAILRALLERYSNRWIPILISALLFALVHMNPAQMPHAFIVGILLGWLYCRTGSIIPGIIIHFVNNTVSFVIAKIYIHQPDISLQELYGGDNTKVLLSLVFSLMIFIPAIYQIWALTKKKANS